MKKFPPHKWSKEIKAWADGEQIQISVNDGIGEWVDTNSPFWDDRFSFRIKSKCIEVPRHPNNREMSWSDEEYDVIAKYGEACFQHGLENK